MAAVVAGCLAAGGCVLAGGCLAPSPPRGAAGFAPPRQTSMAVNAPADDDRPADNHHPPAGSESVWVARTAAALIAERQPAVSDGAVVTAAGGAVVPEAGRSETDATADAGGEPPGDDLPPTPGRFDATPGRFHAVEVVESAASVESVESAESAAAWPVAESIDELVAIALATHPKVRAARRAVAAQRERIPQVRSLPDPVFNNTFWPWQDQALQTAAGRVGNQMGLSQAVPWPEKLRTRAAAAAHESRVAEAELARVEREIVESVRLAYLELWFADRAIEIVEDSQPVVEDLARVAEARYRSGGPQQDVLRAQLEADRLADQLVDLRRQRELAQADLATLLRRPLAEPFRVTPELALDQVPARLDRLIAAAEACNPELRGLAAEIERDRANQRLACLQRYPDLQFGVQWWLVSDRRRAISPVSDGRDAVNFSVGTSLPIWRGKIDAGIREAAHRTAGTRERLDAEREALYGRLRRLLAEADALDQQREIFRDRILPRLDDTLRLAIADYRGERTDFFSVVETYRETLTVRKQLARIEAQLAATVARMGRAVGCPPDSASALF